VDGRDKPGHDDVDGSSPEPIDLTRRAQLAAYPL